MQFSSFENLIYRGCETKQKMIAGAKKQKQKPLFKWKRRKVLLTFSSLKWMGQRFYMKFSILSGEDDNTP